MQEQLQLLPELSNAVSRHYFNLTDDAPHRVHTRIEPKHMMFDVSHKTHYRYSLPVVQSQHLIHMSPRTVGAPDAFATTA